MPAFRSGMDRSGYGPFSDGESTRLREGIHLRAYAQQDPKTVYKKEAYAMFEAMVASLRMEVALSLQRSRVILAVPSEGDDWVQSPPVLDQLPA